MDYIDKYKDSFIAVLSEKYITYTCNDTIDLKEVKEAAYYVVKYNYCSESDLMKEFKVPWERARWLIDMLEMAEIISYENISDDTFNEQRNVLIKKGKNFEADCDYKLSIFQYNLLAFYKKNKTEIEEKKNTRLQKDTERAKENQKKLNKIKEDCFNNEDIKFLLSYKIKHYNFFTGKFIAFLIVAGYFILHAITDSATKSFYYKFLTFIFGIPLVIILARKINKKNKRNFYISIILIAQEILNSKEMFISKENFVNDRRYSDDDDFAFLSKYRSIQCDYQNIARSTKYKIEEMDKSENYTNLYKGDCDIDEPCAISSDERWIYNVVRLASNENIVAVRSRHSFFNNTKFIEYRKLALSFFEKSESMKKEREEHARKQVRLRGKGNVAYVLEEEEEKYEKKLKENYNQKREKELKEEKEQGSLFHINAFGICPYCLKKISMLARKCPHCTADLDKQTS